MGGSSNLFFSVSPPAPPPQGHRRESTVSFALLSLLGSFRSPSRVSGLGLNNSYRFYINPRFCVNMKLPKHCLHTPCVLLEIVPHQTGQAYEAVGVPSMPSARLLVLISISRRSAHVYPRDRSSLGSCSRLPAGVMITMEDQLKQCETTGSLLTGRLAGSAPFEPSLELFPT